MLKIILINSFINYIYYINVKKGKLKNISFKMTKKFLKYLFYNFNLLIKTNFCIKKIIVFVNN